MPANERDNQILEKILKYCSEIEAAHEDFGRSFERFCNSSTYRNAVAMCLLQIPWRAIRGMRNVVAHEYGKIDVETVWETAENGTRELVEFCQQELANEPEITMGM